MKNIKSTKEHEVKLLKMCKKLFLEYEYISIEENDDSEDIFVHLFTKETIDSYIERGCGSRKTQIENIYRWEADINIHWFEFCMTHLIVKLSNEFTKQRLCDADYTNIQYPVWFGQEIMTNLNPFYNKEFEENYEFVHPIDYLYVKFLKLNCKKITNK